MANLIDLISEFVSEFVNYPGRDDAGELLPQADTRWSSVALRQNVQELLHEVQAMDFGDSLHRGAPLLDPPTMSPEQAHARRWRQYECDKIQADIYRAQEQTPERHPARNEQMNDYLRWAAAGPWQVQERQPA